MHEAAIECRDGSRILLGDTLKGPRGAAARRKHLAIRRPKRGGGTFGALAILTREELLELSNMARRLAEQPD